MITAAITDLAHPALPCCRSLEQRAAISWPSTAAALVPAYNEAAIIGSTIKALHKVEEIRDILVVDDGSSDQTREQAYRAGARVVSLSPNRGKGGAILFGSHFIKEPLLAIVDADLGDSAVEIRRLFPAIRAGKAAMTVAVFPEGRSKGGIGMVKRFAKWSIMHTTGYSLQEPLSGQRVLPISLLGLLRCSPKGFGFEVALSIDLLREGYRVVEVETTMSHRERGRDLASCLHRGRQLLAVLRELYLRRELFLEGARQA